MRIKRGEMRPSSDRRLWDMLATEASEFARKMPPDPERNDALKAASLPMRMESSLPNATGRENNKRRGDQISAGANSYSRAGLHNGVNQLR